MDARNFSPLPSHWIRDAKGMTGASFQWTEWVRQREEWTHDHCTFCWACICDQRKSYPEQQSSLREGGHYQHAFLAVDLDGSPTWVCRSCFKALRSVGNWTILRRSPSEVALPEPVPLSLRGH
jgi:hypothetical protein